VHYADWVWFQRSGSLLTFSGAILAARAIVRLGREGARPAPQTEIVSLVGSYYDERGQLMAKTKRTPEAIARKREEKKDEAALVLGFVVGLLGTIIWGYGDLLGKLF
jgi:hypothetical protein